MTERYRGNKEQKENKRERERDRKEIKEVKRGVLIKDKSTTFFVAIIADRDIVKQVVSFFATTPHHSRLLCIQVFSLDFDHKF